MRERSLIPTPPCRRMEKSRPSTVRPEPTELPERLKPSPSVKSSSTKNNKMQTLLFLQPTTDHKWKPHPPLCHPERSRGICSFTQTSNECSLIKESKT